MLTKKIVKEIKGIHQKRIVESRKGKSKTQYFVKLIQIRHKIKKALSSAEYIVLKDTKVIDKKESKQLGIPTGTAFEYYALLSENKLFRLTKKFYNKIKHLCIVITDRTEKQNKNNREFYCNVKTKFRFLKGMIESIFRTKHKVIPSEFWEGFYKITKRDKCRILRKCDIEIQKAKKQFAKSKIH